MKRVAVVAVLVAVAVAAWVWWRGDERRIVRALERLESACEKEGEEGPLALISRTQTILDSFASGFLVSGRPYAGAIDDPRELAAVIHRYRASSDRVGVGHRELELELGPNRTAEMSAVFVVDGVRGARPARESFRARLFWVEHEGEWRIREVEVVERLERSGLFN